MCPLHLRSFLYAKLTHTHTQADTHICWQVQWKYSSSYLLTIRVQYIIKSSTYTNTCKADTFHKSPGSRGAACVNARFADVCDSSSVTLLQEVTSIYLSYTVTSSNTHTHTQYCSEMQPTLPAPTTGISPTPHLGFRMKTIRQQSS